MKELDKLQRHWEIAVCTQARVIANLAATNNRKAQIVEDQAALSLFTMPNEEHLSPQAQEYLNLRRDEQMMKLCKRLAAKREEEDCVATEAARQETDRAREVTRA